MNFYIKIKLKLSTHTVSIIFLAYLLIIGLKLLTS